MSANPNSIGSNGIGAFETKERGPFLETVTANTDIKWRGEGESLVHELPSYKLETQFKRRPYQRTCGDMVGTSLCAILCLPCCLVYCFCCCNSDYVQHRDDKDVYLLNSDQIPNVKKGLVRMADRIHLEAISNRYRNYEYVVFDNTRLFQTMARAYAGNGGSVDIEKMIASWRKAKFKGLRLEDIGLKYVIAKDRMNLLKLLFCEMPTLRMLDISNNHIFDVLTEEQIKMLAEWLNKGQIRSLKIFSNWRTVSDLNLHTQNYPLFFHKWLADRMPYWEAFAQGLQGNPSLIEIDPILPETYIPCISEDPQLLARFQACDNALQTITYRNMKVGIIPEIVASTGCPAGVTEIIFQYADMIRRPSSPDGEKPEQTQLTLK